jgi:hypothetical protein
MNAMRYIRFSFHSLLLDILALGDRALSLGQLFYSVHFSIVEGHAPLTPIRVTILVRDNG